MMPVAAIDLLLEPLYGPRQERPTLEQERNFLLVQLQLLQDAERPAHRCLELQQRIAAIHHRLDALELVTAHNFGWES